MLLADTQGPKHKQGLLDNWQLDPLRAGNPRSKNELGHTTSPKHNRGHKHVRVYLERSEANRRISQLLAAGDLGQLPLLAANDDQIPRLQQICAQSSATFGAWPPAGGDRSLSREKPPSLLVAILPGLGLSWLHNPRPLIV